MCFEQGVGQNTDFVTVKVSYVYIREKHQNGNTNCLRAIQVCSGKLQGRVLTFRVRPDTTYVVVVCRELGKEVLQQRVGDPGNTTPGKCHRGTAAKGQKNSPHPYGC